MTTTTTAFKTMTPERVAHYLEHEIEFDHDLDEEFIKNKVLSIMLEVLKSGPDFYGDEDFFKPFEWIFAGFVYPPGHPDAGQQFELSADTTSAAQNFMALLWMYNMQKDDTIKHAIQPQVLGRARMDLITISIEGV